MEDIPEIDIKNRLKKIKDMGFIESTRENNTGIGYTLESLMGIKENNKRYGDLIYNGELVELKTRRGDTFSRTTLFTKVPSLRNLNDVDLIKKYGYIDKKNRPALKITLINNKPNLQGFRINIDVSNRIISIYDQTNTLIWQWGPNDIVLKFGNLLIVYANRKRIGISEYFHYNSAIYFRGFKEEKFFELMEKGIIVIDYRMHLKPSGKSRNRGTAFRINLNKEKSRTSHKLLEINYLSLLMNCYEKSEKII